MQKYSEGDRTVADEIDKAFRDNVYPGRFRVMYSTTNSEALRYLADLGGRHWSEIIEPTFLREHNVFRLFSLEGFVFYMPAYLIVAVRYPADCIEWCEPLCDMLYPEIPLEQWRRTDRTEQELKKWYELVGALTLSQKHAIRLWLEVLDRCPSACMGGSRTAW